jgi:hypothetical protein
VYKVAHPEVKTEIPLYCEENMQRRDFCKVSLASAGIALVDPQLTRPANREAPISNSPEDGAVLQTLENFLNGWNSRDPARYADALYFPHLILDNGRFTEYPSREQFVAKGKSLWDGVPIEWDHTVWIKRQIVQRIGDTVHVTGTWARKDKAGRTIQTADILYVVVKRDGRWGIFARSGNRAIRAAV